MENVRMLDDKVLVRVMERERNWRGIIIGGDRYDDRWDYEDALVEAVGPKVADLSIGDHVVIRARSGGRAGRDFSRQFGDGAVIVDAEEVLAMVADA